MNTLLARTAQVFARVGDGWDALARAVAATPGAVRQALAAGRGQRRIAVIAATVVLMLYLAAIGDIAVSASGAWTPGMRFAPEGLFQVRAPYLFEPVAAVFAGSHVAVFLSPINLFLGGLLALLASATITLAAHGARQAVACRRPGYSRALAVLPAFLLGFACCVPTFVLALGAGTAAAVLPVLLPLRSLFYPLSVLLLLAGVVWGAHRTRAHVTGNTARDTPPPVRDTRRSPRRDASARAVLTGHDPHPTRDQHGEPEWGEHGANQP